MKVRRLCFPFAAFAVSALLATPPAHGATSTPKPTWWSKYLAVSSLDLHSVAAASASSAGVGPNVDVSNEPGPQSETSIAIDPSNPARLVAGSNEIFRLPMRGYFSSDGGNTWGGVDLPLPPPKVRNGSDFGSDPGVAWDSRGNVYYSYIVVFFGGGFVSSPVAVPINGTEMAVARSSDGGRTWRATYFDFQDGESKFDDKPMIAVDTSPTSPHRNTIYVAWDHAGGNSTNGVVVSRSTDGGRTFSRPVFASQISNGNNGVIGADPFVSPDGTLRVAWNDWVNSRIAASTSRNAGQSFGPTVTIATDSIGFDIALPSIQSRHALVSPACGADTSTGPNRGRLYCSWTDGTLSTGTDVFVSRSTDGAIWSPPHRVNDDPAGAANDQYYQWLAVDPVTGAVDLSWYDTRNDPSRASTDVYFATSSDGRRFSSNVRVTTAPTNETCCGAELFNQYGDYEGIAAFGGSAHPVWTDRRASLDPSLSEEVFTAAVRTR